MGRKERRQAKKKARKGTLYAGVDFSGSPTVEPPDIFGRTGNAKLTGTGGVSSPLDAVTGRLSQRRSKNLYGN